MNSIGRFGIERQKFAVYVQNGTHLPLTPKGLFATIALRRFAPDRH